MNLPAPETNSQAIGGDRHTGESPAMSAAEASRMLGLSKNATYRAITRGDIPALRFGRRVVVPRKRLRQMLGLEDN